VGIRRVQGAENRGWKGSKVLPGRFEGLAADVGEASVAVAMGFERRRRML
jgi:hypothetical protein